MKSCKEYLSFEAKDDHDETEVKDDIALPFFEAMKVYIIKIPTKGKSINNASWFCLIFDLFTYKNWDFIRSFLL